MKDLMEWFRDASMFSFFTGLIGVSFVFRICREIITGENLLKLSNLREFLKKGK